MRGRTAIANGVLLGAALSSALAAMPACTSPKPLDRDLVASSEGSRPTTTAALRAWGPLGGVVTIEGVAIDAKLGAQVLVEGRPEIWIDGLSAWPGALRGKRVRVTGTIIERADLPVFVEGDGPVRAGMPVPKGTDLDQARRRRLLADARWTAVDAAP